MLRIQDAAIGHDFIRGGLENVDSVEVLDKYTVRINAKVADAALPTSIMRYPIVLMAPDAFDTAAERPIGTGPSSSSPGRAIATPGWCALRTTGRPMPRGSLPYLDEVHRQTQARGLGPPDGAAHRAGPSHR